MTTLRAGWRWHSFGDMASSPFQYGNCVTLAYTAVQPAPTEAKARELARLAMDKGLLDWYGRAPARGEPQWAALIGYRIAERFEPVITRATVMCRDAWGGWYERWQKIGAPTLAQFAKGIGAHGHWVAYTYAHAQAVVDGKVCGYASMRRRLRYAVRVEPLT